MKIDLLVGDNDYATEQHFAQALAAALERLGFSTRLFWVGEGHFFHALHEMMKEPPDWSCSFSDISLEGKPLGSLWTIPHLSWFADPPIYFLHQLTAAHGWSCCVDEKDLAFVRSLGFERSFFLPHAAEISCKTEVDQERPFDCVFFGSCIDYEALETAWPARDKELLLEACRLVLSPQSLSIAEVLISLGVGAADFARLHDEVDRYTRGKDRVELIRSIKGARTHIWGKGSWSKYFPSHPVHPPIAFKECLKVMQQSKVVLNSSPRFKAGAHERVFYALMCGAAPMTARNGFVEAHVPETFTYRSGEWEAPDLSSWKQRAMAGQENVVRNHTWDARAEKLARFFRQKKNP